MDWAIEEKGYSQRRACGLVGMEPKTYRYASKRGDDAALRQRLRDLPSLRRRFGYRRLLILLQRVRCNKCITQYLIREDLEIGRQRTAKENQEGDRQRC